VLCRLMRARDTFVPPSGSESPAKVFDVTEASSLIVLRPMKNHQVRLHSTYGDEVLYTGTTYPAVDPATVFLGRRVELSPALVSSFGLHLKLTIEHTYERLRTDDGQGYRARITELRAIHQFSLRSFLRAIMQYTDVEDFSGYEYELLRTQLLYSYKINPRTVLFAGYADGHFGDVAVNLTQRNRRFFVKLGYAWVP